jgi:hypothetical protein
MKTDQTGHANASKIPASKASNTINGIEATSSHVAAASGAAVQTEPHWVTISILRRSNRSASAPAGKLNTSRGAMRAKLTTPSRNAEFPSSRTSQPSATLWTQEPVAETNEPIMKRV